MNGIGVSPGISIGNAFIMPRMERSFSGLRVSTGEEMAGEMASFDQAVILSVAEIEILKANFDPSTDEDSLQILDTQIEFLTDPQLRVNAFQKVNQQQMTIHDALLETIRDAVAVFSEMDDEYLKARAADVQDIGDRIFRNLNPQSLTTALSIKPGSILIAGVLSPSETLSLDLKQIIGFATEGGGQTSHAAIVARARGIPAIVGCGPALQNVQQGDALILDGGSGQLIHRPTADEHDRYIRLRQEHRDKNDLLRGIRHRDSVTPDGRQFRISGNISDAAELEPLFENGGEGVGLFRTEFLYLGRNSFPEEEEQFEFYRRAALLSNGKTVIIRTCDIGGDKQLSYFGIGREENPFLGYRAIRIWLDRPDLFIAQLKAILRAAIYGDLKIMFPMISNVREIRSVKKLVERAKLELSSAGIPYRQEIAIGIMVEVPAAALTADLLAKEVDFFSIGTNDLCQYTLAADRMNEKVKNLYDPYHPAVLRLIAYTIEQAHKYNIHVGICGELAADPMAARLLMGMGLDEFSMSSPAIPAIKNILLQTEYTRAKDIWTRVQEMEDGDAIKEYLQQVNAE